MQRPYYPNPKLPTVLLSGATGMVGQYVLAELLQQGGQLAVLVRGRMNLDVRLRLESLCRFWEKRLGRVLPRPRGIQADLAKDGLGISSADRAWIARNVDCVLHNAASVRFLADERGIEPQATNVEGTRRMLGLASSLGVPRFHHVSTAFVCGERTGRILESELNCGQAFNNPYEASKAEAEKLVQASRSQFDSVSIYRPSVVVGDSHDGFTSTFQTIYSVVRFLLHLHSGEREDASNLFRAFHLTGKEQKNLVPVDWVAKTMVRLLYEPDAWGQTYHLTNQSATSLDQIASALGEAIQLESEAWKGMTSMIERVPVEIAARQTFEPFAGYFRSDPHFDTSNLLAHAADLPSPSVDHAMLVRLFRFAIQERLQNRIYAMPSGCPGWFPELDRHESTSGDVPVHRYRLQLLGEFGGIWDLPLTSAPSANAHAASTGLSTEPDHRPTGYVRATSQTWHALLHGKLEFTAAMQHGRILIQAPRDWQSPIVQALQHLVLSSLQHGELNSDPNSAKAIQGASL